MKSQSGLVSDDIKRENGGVKRKWSRREANFKGVTEEELPANKTEKELLDKRETFVSYLPSLLKVLLWW